MTANPHLRAIVIAGVLAAVALGLGFVTLGMNQSSSAAAPHRVLSLKARGLASAANTKAAAPHTTKPAAEPAKRKPAANPHLTAALKGGLPRSVANGLAAHRVTVVALTSSADAVAKLAAQEAAAGAKEAGAAFVAVSVDRDGGDASNLTALIGSLPAAPAVLVYIRPATLYVLMPGFNDKSVVHQAAHTAADATAAPAAPPATTTPATPPVATAAT